MFEGGLFVFIAFMVAILIASVAHQFGEVGIREDCDRLGQFYIGEVVYECKVKK
jgi:hypothetical protein